MIVELTKVEKMLIYQILCECIGIVEDEDKLLERYTDRDKKDLVDSIYHIMKILKVDEEVDQVSKLRDAVSIIDNFFAGKDLS